MKNRWLRSFISSSMSILPMIAIVLVLALTGIAPLSSGDYLSLGIGAAILIAGLSLFQIGASQGLSKVGEYMGSSLSKQANIWIIVIFAFLLGTLITCAEPSILIVSAYIKIPTFVLIGSIALGVGIFVVIGILRVIFQASLRLWYLFLYFIVFLIICLMQIDPNAQPFLPIIFDAGGVTTGSATVPFILALGVGVATVRGGKNANRDSFGLVGMASIGPILTMTLLIAIGVSPLGTIIFGQSMNATAAEQYHIPVNNASLWENIVKAITPTGLDHMGSFIEVLIAILPIIIIFAIYQFMYIKLPKNKMSSLILGFAFAYGGLVMFLTGVNAAMAPLGMKVGVALGDRPDSLVIFLCFIIGMVTILCEPAVHSLTTQIESVSDGHIKSKTVLMTLSIGVGIAICLAGIRSIYHFSIMYYVVPGYLLSIALMFVTPEIYTAMGFDSGGTASGPMAVSFVVPMITGMSVTKFNATSIDPATNAFVYQNTFGVVTMIALIPIIAIEVLGIVVKFQQIQALKVMRLQKHDEGNAEIIHFC
ncbi:MAG: DUF1538 domain-containing protein [Bacilli bacterium]|nr:DUF1538 domain-containing protein [Bacilli bacterium]